MADALKVKARIDRRGRVLFLEGTPNRPLQIPVQKGVDLEEIEISADQVQRLLDAGAELEVLQLGATTPEQLEGEILSVSAGHEGSLNGTKSMTFPIAVKTDAGTIINTTISMPAGTPAKYDRVVINKYNRKGLHLQLAGESSDRPHQLMYVLEPGTSSLKVNQVRNVTADELVRDTAAAELKAAQLRVAALEKALVQA